MRKYFVPMMIGVVLMLAPVMAMAAASMQSVTGSVQGFQCVTQGKVCPVGKEDPMAAVENVFVVLVDAAKGDYYFVPNVDRSVLTRHINEQVKVEGTLNAKMKSITAANIYTMDAKKAWKKVWSANLEDDIYRDIFGVLPMQAQ